MQASNTHCIYTAPQNHPLATPRTQIWTSWAYWYNNIYIFVYGSVDCKTPVSSNMISLKICSTNAQPQLRQSITSHEGLGHSVVAFSSSSSHSNVSSVGSNIIASHVQIQTCIDEWHSPNWIGNKYKINSRKTRYTIHHMIYACLYRTRNPPWYIDDWVDRW